MVRIARQFGLFLEHIRDKGMLIIGVYVAEFDSIANLTVVYLKRLVLN